SPRREPDVQHRTLSASAVRATRDQGSPREFQGTEEGQGIGQARGREEEERRQEEDQASQDRQACGQTQAGYSQRTGSAGRGGWAGAAEAAQLSSRWPTGSWPTRAVYGARSAVPRVGNGATAGRPPAPAAAQDRKSTRLNSSHVKISYAVFCLKKKKQRMRS